MSDRLKITIAGESKTRAQWAKALGITRGAIHFRERKFRESPQEAVWHFYYAHDNDTVRKLRARLADVEKAIGTLCDPKVARALETIIGVIGKLKGGAK